MIGRVVLVVVVVRAFINGIGNVYKQYEPGAMAQFGLSQL